LRSSGRERRQEVGLLCHCPRAAWSIAIGQGLLAHRSLPDLASAEAAADAGSVAVEAFGEYWLLTIEEGGWQSGGGKRVAEIRPLPVEPADTFTAQDMEATFQPGMKSGIAQRSGPEAWHTLSGEGCLETPEGTMVGRAGGKACHRARGRTDAGDGNRVGDTTRTRARAPRLVQAGRDADR
jgi:hypothetical protein